MFSQSSRAPYRSLINFAFVLVVLLICVHVQSLAQNGKQYTSTMNDLNERGNVEIDPSSLGLNISISLAGYPGRGASLPVTLRYSSKVWRIKYLSTQMVNNSGFGDGTPFRYLLAPAYSENSRQGWTSSLSVPYVEFTGAVEPFTVRFSSTRYLRDYLDGGKTWDWNSPPLIVTDMSGGCVPEFDPWSCEIRPFPYYSNRAILHMPDGSSHEMRQDDLVYSGNSGPGNRMYYAVDGSRVKYNPVTQEAFLSDGSRYLLNTANGAQFIDRNGNSLNYSSVTGQWTDTLGRTVLNPLDGNGSDYQWTIPTAQGGTATYILRWRSLGQVLSDTSQALRYTGILTEHNPATQPPYVDYISPSLFGEIYPGGPGALAEVFTSRYSNSQPDLFNPNVLSEIVLPNGQKYRFTYNIYGEIDKVYLPTGGYRRYRFDRVPASDYDNASVAYSQANRGVVEAWDSVTGNPQDETPISWKFQPTTTPNYYITATNPDGTYVRRYIHYRDAFNSIYNASPGEAKVGRIYDEQFYSATGTMLRRTLTNWVKTNAQGFPVNPQAGNPVGIDWAERNARISRQVEILLDTSGNALASATEMDYDDYLNVKETRHYDYVSVSQNTAQNGVISSIPNGTLLRKEEATYLVMDTTASLPSGVTLNDYINRNLIALPSKMIIKDGANNVIAATEYKYDEYPLTTYAAVANWISTPSPGNVRGNATTVRRWQDYNYVTGQSQPWSGWTSGIWVEAHSWYDQCGNVIKTKDPKGNDTVFDYTDNFSDQFNRNTYAYLKSVTSPNPGASYGGNQPLVSNSVYHFSSGKVVSTTDPNSKITSFEYTDPLDRLTKVIRPSGGGQTTYTYGDTVGDLFLITQTQQSPGFGGITLRDYGSFDGLGRAKRSAHQEKTDFQGNATEWSVRDNVYDALGRVSQVSNPALVSSYTDQLPSGTGWTTTTYDALSRVTRVTTPDLAHVDTIYLGNKVTVADQTGKQRSSITDGLGRLIQVNEAPNDPAYNYQTNYTYDALGNLIRVRQGGFPTGGSSDPSVQFRRFYYDSLSRLVYANNPEQNATIAFNPPGEVGTMWTMKYVYDDNGNLTSRTDARNVVTTYGYDTLNRNTTVEYSDTPAITGPDIKRFYDTATNGKGRLQRVETYAVNPQNSVRADSRTIVGGYDNIGRVTSQSQGFWKPANNTWQDYTVSRTYDLASHVSSQSYPSGNSVSYAYNAGGRSFQSSGSLGGDSGASYSYGIKYNAAGQAIEEQLGLVFHRMDYNNRFQMTEVRLGGTSTDPLSWDLGKLRFFYNSNAKTNENPALDGTDNNGNVLRQEHWVPTSVSNVVQGGNTIKVVNQYAVPMRDDYFYDPINRITQVQGWQRTTGTATPAQIYQQGYTYDKFGNRKLDAANTWGNLINGTLPADIYDVSKLTNQLAGGFYDRAGNLRVDPGLSLKTNDRTYDAENRMTVAKVANVSSYYVYDGDGRRVRRIVNGVETWQVYGIDGELLAEYPVNGIPTTPKKEYGYRDGQLLVVADPTEVTNKKVQWLIADHLGTPRMTLDKTGSLSGVTRHDYLPFGEELMVGMGISNSVRQPALGYMGDSVRQKFGAEERDPETGLDFFASRYFSSIQGRFSSADRFSGRKTNPQTLNLYAYVLNNPLKWVDPTGHFAEDPNQKEKVENCKCTLVIDSGVIERQKPGFWSKVWGGIKKVGKAIGTGADIAGNAFFGAGTPAGFESSFPEMIHERTGVHPGTVFAGVVAPEIFGPYLAEGSIAAEGSTVVVDVFSESGLVLTEEGGGLAFSQATASADFSEEGFFAFKTIGQLANELRTGLLTPGQVPVGFIEGEGTNLIVNTRSSLALMRANIPSSQWTLVNLSGNAKVELEIGKRLLSNGLTRQGASTIRISDKILKFGKDASSLR